MMMLFLLPLSFMLFTEIFEDANSYYVARLRLIRTDRQKHRLVLAEDPKFVKTLKAQFDAISSLPYFVNVTELSLMFDCEQAAVNAQANGSVANYVFSHVRKQPALSKFLVNVLSELRVVLSCYDSGM